MDEMQPPKQLSCVECAHGAGLGFDFSMAFQPIVDVVNRQVLAYEALVRGAAGQPAGWVLSQVNHANRYRFDQACRVKAIELAARLGIETLLSINFMPNAVYRPETCIRTTFEAAGRFGFPTHRIMFEFTEGEQIEDHSHLLGVIQEYKRLGFKTAIDDFGAGYAGLNLLARFQPDLLKIDMELIRRIDTDRVRQAIVKGIAQLSRDIGCRVIAEGVETAEELSFLQEIGIQYYQGFYFAKPAFEQIPDLVTEGFAPLIAWEGTRG
ncbi:MAG: EAL domain-containing protein [Blastocatellia bacterium]|nr:EAL domain-containing protein [Blastocatellia bacterium]